MSGDQDWVLALDFGTTATAAAIRSADGSVSALMLAESAASTMPSSVFAEDDGHLVAGTEADNEAEIRLDSYEPTPKRRVDRTLVRLGDSEYAPRALIGAVIAPVLTEALRQHNNAAPTEVVMTHPYSWRAQRKRVLREALHEAAGRLNLAQLPAPVFVAEPVAAARWYAQSEPLPDGAFFAVYDLGGGTFDTAVLRTSGDGFEVVACGGIDPLGGFDFDQLLFNYLGDKYIAAVDAGLWADLCSAEQLDPGLARQRRQMHARVRLLKEALSRDREKSIRLPGVHDQKLVTRDEYEQLIRGHIDDSVTELTDTIGEAGLEVDQISVIYRIGGAARTPLVGAALNRLRLPVNVKEHPKLVVAKGAAALTPAPRRKPKQAREHQLLFDYLGRNYIAPADPGLWAALSAPGQTDPDLVRMRDQLQERVRQLKEALGQRHSERIRLPGVRDEVLVTRDEYDDLTRQHGADTAELSEQLQPPVDDRIQTAASEHGLEVATETKRAAEEILALARAQAEAILSQARGEYDVLQRDAERSHASTIATIKAQRMVLEGRLESLRAFEQAIGAQRHAPGERSEKHAELEIAGRLAELSEDTANRLLSMARAEADKIVRDARSQADVVRGDAERKYTEIMATIDQQRTVLEGRLEQLRAFEREYRNRLNEEYGPIADN